MGAQAQDKMCHVCLRVYGELMSMTLHQIGLLVAFACLFYMYIRVVPVRLWRRKCQTYLVGLKQFLVGPWLRTRNSVLLFELDDTLHGHAHTSITASIIVIFLTASVFFLNML